MAGWNPWHGCVKFSDGCKNCYVYRIDAEHGRDASEIKKTADFNLPVRKGRNGEYKIPSGDMVYTCFTSDFLLDKADEWRAEAWQMIKQRSDIRFFFITKRIHRIYECLPDDWGDGYENVGIGCTCENQAAAQHRLPIFLTAPIKYRTVICEPLLGEIDLSPYLNSGVAQVVAGGESGNEARVCDYEWVKRIRGDCVAADVPFWFKQTGARLKKDGRVYRVPRKLQSSQARKANIDYRY